MRKLTKLKKKNGTNKIEFNFFNIFFSIFILLLICSFVCWGIFFYLQNVYGQKNLSVEVVQIAEEEKLDTLTPSQYSFVNNVKGYSDVVLSVIVSICVAVISITATIFIFSKSALDRINDENEYVADVVNIHKKRNINQLAWLCAGSAVLIMLPIFWHALLTFGMDVKMPEQTLICGLISLMTAILIYLVMTGIFWHNCVCVEKSLKKIIKKEYLRLENILNNLLPLDEQGQRLASIGDWYCWEDKSPTAYIEEGKKLCRSMLQDQFVNQFQKAERLLLSGEAYQSGIPNSNDIVTILQERRDILEPNSRVEEEDLKERSYIEKNGTRKEKVKIVDCIGMFERQVGFSIEKNSTTGDIHIPVDFFVQTEKLYNILKDYRNLLISEHYTQLKIYDNLSEQFKAEQMKKSGKIVREQRENEEKASELFVQAYYYFLLRILAVFASSVRIANYSLNGSSLNYANFYSSTLENITIYSAECYRTVFARVKFEHVIMDISRLFDIDFYCARLIDSSFNNANMENVQFEHSTVQAVGFDSCYFVSCSMLNSDLKECIFNNSEFTNTTMKASNFSYSKFREIKWIGGEIEGCSFRNAEFHNWDSRRSLSLKNCDFSDSVWSQMSIKKWHLEEGVFDSADLSGIIIEGGSMQSASLIQCQLDGSHIIGCDMSRSALQNASLFSARIEKSNMSTSDLTNVIAVKTTFVACDFSNSNCAEADFSEAKIIGSKLFAARLYDCAMVASKIEECNARYLLADHLQFTFAKCKDSDFSYSSLSESNLTKSVFSGCTFDGCDLSNLNATQTIFENCKLVRVDFSGTRFVKSCFRWNSEKKQDHIFRNCNFSSCSFEGVQFESVKFIDCLFENAVFVRCTIENKFFELLSEQNFSKISNRGSDTIIWL